MKYPILILIILLSYSFSSNTIYKSTYKFSETRSNLAEQVYNKLVVSQRISKISNLYLDRISRKRTEVPTNIWNNIKQNLDYSDFKKAVIQILWDNYTDPELLAMLIDPANARNIPLTLDIRNKIQLEAEEFSQDLVNQTNAILVANGFNRL